MGIVHPSVGMWYHTDCILVVGGAHMYWNRSMDDYLIRGVVTPWFSKRMYADIAPSPVTMHGVRIIV